MEVSLAEHNNVVKALPSDRADQPFGISVLPAYPSSGRKRSILTGVRIALGFCLNGVVPAQQNRVRR